MTNLIQITYQFILNLFLSLINIILLPVSVLIDTLIPSVSNAISYITDGLEWILNFLQFIMGWLHIPSFALSMILSYIILVITLRPVITSIKLIIAWYKSIK